MRKFLNSRTVDAFDYDVDTGEIKNRRTVIDVQSFEPFEHVSAQSLLELVAKPCCFHVGYRKV